MTKVRFELESNNRGISDEEMLEDIAGVAKKLEKSALTYKEYRAGGGKLDSSHIQRRLGSWNSVLAKVGLEPARKVNLSDLDLFENIQEVWIRLGRQPRRREIDSEISIFSSRPYLQRFGGWTAALEAFIEYIGSETSAPASKESPTPKRKTSRDPSLRLKFLVMKRDGFRCVHCGKSPANEVGVELHIDHILPWSKGGESTLENLQTLCSRCNLGKGNELE